MKLDQNNANMMDENGWTPLIIAVFFQHMDINEKPIAAGADVNAKGWRGVTPLHKAAVGGGAVLEELRLLELISYKVLELLITKGADVNAKDEDGLTPLMYAVLEGNKESVKMLILKGANLNVKDEDGETALHYAGSFGQNEIFEILINNGADLNMKDNRGRTPLDSIDIGLDRLSKCYTMYKNNENDNLNKRTSHAPNQFHDFMKNDH